MTARIRIAILGLIVGLLAAGSSVAVEPPPHMIVFSATFGYRHAGIPKMVETLEHLAELSGDFTVEHVTAAADFGPDLYARADAIMFLQTTGSPPFDAARRAEFLRFFECGGAFLGVHAASDSGSDWAGYTELIGARFAGHAHFGSLSSYQEAGWSMFGQPPHFMVDLDVPALTDVTVNVEDQTHAATAPWHGMETFRFSDELYQYQDNPREVPGLHVLLSLDNQSDYWPLAPAAPNPRVTLGQISPWLGYTDQTPLAWTKSYGDGRVFYTNLGHNPETWDVIAYQQHLLGGLAWATEIRADAGCLAG